MSIHCYVPICSVQTLLCIQTQCSLLLVSVYQQNFIMSYIIYVQEFSNFDEVFKHFIVQGCSGASVFKGYVSWAITTRQEYNSLSCNERYYRSSVSRKRRADLAAQAQWSVVPMYQSKVHLIQLKQTEGQTGLLCRILMRKHLYCFTVLKIV